MKKKLVFIFRDPGRKQFSIEEIFINLSRELSEKYETVNYLWNGNISLLSNIRSLRNLRADHYHITGDVHYAAMFFRKRITMTLHDIGHYESLQGWKKMVYRKLWIDLPIQFCNGINTISQFTKENFEKHFPEYRGKLEVIHNPLNPIFDEYPMPSDETIRILHIGTGPMKNLDTLVKACEDTDYHIDIVGKLNNRQKTMLECSNVNYINHFNLSTEAIRDLYQECHLVHFVSLYEGFGMPVIEGQATGRPVLVSRKCSLPEVASDSALYIENPEDSREIRAAIDKLSTNKKFREHIIEEGLLNVRRFRIEKVAKTYADFFRRTRNKRMNST